MRKIILLLILTGIGLQAYSQNTGYLGKHVILKTDLINGKRMGFRNIDLEVVAGRRTSFISSFRTFAFAGSSETTEIKNGYETRSVYSDELDMSMNIRYYKYTRVIPGESKGWLATVGAKHYFNKVLPAPLGFYSSFEMGFGKSEFSYTSSTVTKPDFSDQYFQTYWESTGPKTVNAECSLFYFTLPSIGYQTIFTKRLIVDAKFQFELINNNLTEELKKEYSYPVFSTNLSTAKAGSTTIGPAIYGKIGLLLF